MASRRLHRRDSSSTSPSSPSHSIDSSSSSLDSSQGVAANHNAAPRVSVSQHQETGASTTELSLLHGENIEANYSDIAYLCPYSQQSTIRGTLTVTNYRLYFK